MRMLTAEYVKDKTRVALDSLASGTGTFEKRLYYAYAHALILLDNGVLPEEIAEKLNWVLQKCKRNYIPSRRKMKRITKPDRDTLVEKLISVLICTAEGG